LALVGGCADGGAPERPAQTRLVGGGRRVTPDGWFAQPRLTKPVVPEEVTRAYVIDLRGPISSRSARDFRRKAARCKSAGAELIIIDLDTFGGELAATFDICRVIKRDLDNVYTVCYVRPRAISGGAAIALACDEIVMTPAGMIGDCMVMVASGRLSPSERHKIEAVIRAELTESARLNGHSIALAEAMVSPAEEVWLIRNVRTRELRHVLERDWRGRARIPQSAGAAPSDDQAEWELLRTVVRPGELATFTALEAVEAGLASRVVEPPQDSPLRGLLEQFNVRAEPLAPSGR
jgi:membrane-bound serine protease (ClpP class)